MPRTDTADQEHLLQQGQPAVHCLAVHPKSTSEFGCVEQLPGRDRRVVDQLPQSVKFPDRRDFGNVALGKRACVSAEPGSPPRRSGASKHFREPPAEHPTG